MLRVKPSRSELWPSSRSVPLLSRTTRTTFSAPNLGGFGRKGVELRNDGLFVRNGHVEAREHGMFAHPVAEVAHFGEVEIVILRVDVFAGELLGEKRRPKNCDRGDVR